MKTTVAFLLFVVCVALHASTHELVLVDDLAIHLQFDRTYDVQKVEKTDDPTYAGKFAYMMTPKDQQSAVTILVGFEPVTEASIASDQPRTKIKKVKGRIAQFDVQWFDYKDRSHFYADCSLNVPLSNGSSAPISINLVANSRERLDSLVDSLSNMKVISKRAEPGATDNPDDAEHLREDH